VLALAIDGEAREVGLGLLHDDRQRRDFRVVERPRDRLAVGTRERDDRDGLERLPLPIERLGEAADARDQAASIGAGGPEVLRPPAGERGLVDGQQHRSKMAHACFRRNDSEQADEPRADRFARLAVGSREDGALERLHRFAAESFF